MLITTICVLPHYTKHVQDDVVLLQKFNDAFDVCKSCDRILLAVIRKKWIKHFMPCEWLYCCCFYLCWCTNFLQWNTFNRYRYISEILFRLYLVCKTSYHSLSIIATTQHIFICAVTFECFLVFGTTVISHYNSYVWKVKC